MRLENAILIPIVHILQKGTGGWKIGVLHLNVLRKIPAWFCAGLGDWKSPVGECAKPMIQHTLYYIIPAAQFHTT
jgi:hypothetical protein